ncbi:MAG: hypothetical protein ACRDSH_24660 [Pseudonocardiaceae bacterium]
MRVSEVFAMGGGCGGHDCHGGEHRYGYGDCDDYYRYGNYPYGGHYYNGYNFG